MKDVTYSGTPLRRVPGVSFPGATGSLLSPVLADMSVPPAANTVAMPSEEVGEQSFYRVYGKRALDIFLVFLSLPVTVPIMVLCAVALWIESGLPFYQQNRLGRDGRYFKILKLRTMVRDADELLQKYLQDDPELREEWETTQKLKRDPRITLVGGFLRKTSLDELPQIWNVLKGDMSLVGPRPMMPDQLEIYGEPSSYFALRPGITGVWQVSARNETHFCQRARIDMDYFKLLSFPLDLKLLLKTVGVVCRRTGY
ncbi:sugar transferase [Primorskyibacter sp. S87]|uniref:sugar transferase n=1 Tax=Primorskyibacter sp. S87 TaxID=3415126 RepID=UPI003C7B526D